MKGASVKVFFALLIMISGLAGAKSPEKDEATPAEKAAANKAARKTLCEGVNVEPETVANNPCYADVQALYDRKETQGRVLEIGAQATPGTTRPPDAPRSSVKTVDLTEPTVPGLPPLIGTPAPTAPAGKDEHQQ